jgi:transcriptional regulator
MKGHEVFAQTQPESLFIPKPHRVEDRALLHDFMDEYDFVEFVTAARSIRITHIPVLLDRTAGPYGTLYGHVSRNNPQSRVFNGRHSAVSVFRGPHSYISPAWYANTEAVPTWNFAVVHASGKPKPVHDKEVLYDLLYRMVNRFENRYGQGSYNFAKLPDNYTHNLISGIVGFEMQIDSLEGKFKLGQERSDGDRAGILENLERAKPDRSLYMLTANFYERLKPGQ